MKSLATEDVFIHGAAAAVSLSTRAGAKGANPEPQRTRERLHRGGVGPPGAHLPLPAEGLLPRVGHQRGARGEDPQAAQHHAEEGASESN